LRDDFSCSTVEQKLENLFDVLVLSLRESAASVLHLWPVRHS
jgi:hypothetical protein